MTVREPFKFLHSFSAALAAGVLLVYASQVSAAPVVQPPPLPNAGAPVKIQTGEHLDKDGYTKKAKPPEFKHKVKQNPNDPGQTPMIPGKTSIITGQNPNNPGAK